jgi:hypothetical protein
VKIQPRDGTSLKLVITGMIVSKEVLGRVAEVWKPKLFGQPWADLVANWCVSWYVRYKTAPQDQIKQLFHIWAEDDADETTEKTVAAFLGGLSDEYDAGGFNPGHVIDLAGEVINRNRLVLMRNRLDAALAVNDLERAELAVQNPRVEVGANAAVDVFASQHLIKEAVLSRVNMVPLIKLPGAIGAFTDILFERESLVAFEAPEKRGKSWWLQEMAWQGVLQGKRVAFFSCGDLSLIQQVRRLVTRAVGRPIIATKDGQRVKIPTFLEIQEGTLPKVTYSYHEYPQPLEWKEAWRQFVTISRMNMGGQRDLFRLSTHGTNTLTVAGLQATLDRWASDGWRPEVVVIDYADILGPPPGLLANSKEAIDHNWAALRSMSIVDHTLILTATQANAAAYSVEVMGKQHFSGSKGKNAQVTAMIGINQTPGEKDLGIYRLNLPAARDSELNDQTCVTTVGCLAVGNPCIISSF